MRIHPHLKFDSSIVSITGLCASIVGCILFVGIIYWASMVWDTNKEASTLSWHLCLAYVFAFLSAGAYTLKKISNSASIQATNFWTHIAYAVSTVVLALVFVTHSTDKPNRVLVGYLCLSYLIAFVFVCLRLRNYRKMTSISLFPILITLLNALGVVLIIRTKMPDFFWSATLWVWCASVMYFMWRNYKSNVFMHLLTPRHKMLLMAVAVIAIFIFTLPMSMTPVNMNRFPVKQYEDMGAQLLKGKLYLDYNVDPKLMKMENPYDPRERRAKRISYHEDSVFYNGKYYMYFGVVPAAVLFAPYQFVTGKPLLWYQGTQVFAALAIIGIFSLFSLIVKIFSARIPLSLYTAAALAFSVQCIHRTAPNPVIYTTSIVAGVCFEVWSIYFFLRAGWHQNETLRSRILYLTLGSLCGSLVFGCRPPIGLVSVLVIPVLIRMKDSFCSSRAENVKVFSAVLLPYMIVGSLLAIYNYVRFGNIIEFGLSYQLLGWDQTDYYDFFKRFSVAREMNAAAAHLLAPPKVGSHFPFISFGGAFLLFPALLLAFLLLDRLVCSFLERHGLRCFAYMILLLPLPIVLADAYLSIGLQIRYQMDFSFLLGIASFMAVCAYYETGSETLKKVFDALFPFASLATITVVLLLFFIPQELEFVTIQGPGINTRIDNILMFRVGK